MENCTELWENDSLGATKFGRALYRNLLGHYDAVVQSRQGTEVVTGASLTVAINGSWGRGKTFLLTNLYEELKLIHPVVYFNAWETDFADHPMTAFSVEIYDQLKINEENNASLSVKARGLCEAGLYLAKRVGIHVAASTVAAALSGGASLVANAAIGSVLNAATKSVESDGLSPEMQERQESERQIVQYSSTKAAVARFRNALQDLIENISGEEIKLPMFILVDELDRCRPTYAVELLESIKHFFGVSGVYFVIATNLDELAHSVSALYGERFSSRSYLDRFFDVEMEMPLPRSFDFIRNRLDSDLLIDLGRLKEFGSARVDQRMSVIAEQMSVIADGFSLAARDIEQALSYVGQVLNWKAGRYLHIVPLFYLICIRQKWKQQVSQFLLSDKYCDYEELKSLMPPLRNRNLINLPWYNHGTLIKSLPVGEVIRVYVAIAQQVYDEQSIDRGNDVMRMEVATSLRNDGKEYIENDRGAGKHELLKYPSLVYALRD